jgi:Protein of unknown function (DUF3500)
MTDVASAVQEMARAAAGFLDSLTDPQRDRATQSFEDDSVRRKWFYTPTPRAGLPIREMNPIQHQWVRRMLGAGLSEAGYNYAALVMGLEYVVDYHSHFPDRTWGDQPGSRVRDQGNYTVAVFGTPDERGVWSWTIGGHHLSLHFTCRDGRVSPTPAFFGAEPARTPLPGGQVFRLLAAEEDSARDLLAMLDPDQRARAIISPIAATDIVQTNRPTIEDGALYQVGGTGPGGQGLREELGLTPELDEKLRYSSSPKGLPARDMTGEQRRALVRITSAYLSHLSEGVAAPYAALLDPEQLGDAAFAWAGTAELAAPHYYRVQSERLLIEYDCTQNQANHTHSVWRDPRGDFGSDLLADHYAEAQ